MSTLKVNTIGNKGSAVDFPNKLKVRGNAIEQGYTASGTEPSSPSAGDIWYDSANEVTYQYINGEFKSISMAAGFTWGGARGVIGGGINATDSKTNVIQYITIASTGNSTDFGDLTVTRAELAAVSNSTRAVFGGGDDGSSGASSVLDTMDYVTTATTANATDFGNLAGTRQAIAGCGDGTYGLFGGGDNYSYKQNRIHLITVATAANATTFGNLTVARTKLAAVNDATYGVWGGGDSGSVSNVMDYVTMASAGNATDFGDLGAAIENNTGVGDTSRGCFAGGNTSGRVNTIEYITIASTGNATDFGDLSATKTGMGATGCSDGTYGTFQGGYDGSARVNTIEYITVQTTGNVTDFGDLLQGNSHHAGCSGNAS